jgi:hypothetical protein
LATAEPGPNAAAKCLGETHRREAEAEVDHLDDPGKVAG